MSIVSSNGMLVDNVKRCHKQLRVLINNFFKNIFIYLEFLEKISFLTKKQLTEIFRTCKKNLKVNVIFKSSNRIRNAFRFKDMILIFMNSKEVYKFKCNICNDAYIGETKRHLLVRQYEHLGKSILTEKPSKQNDKTQLP